MYLYVYTYIQASIDTEKGFMFSTSYSPLMLQNITKRLDTISVINDEKCSTAALDDQISSLEIENDIQNGFDGLDSSSGTESGVNQNDGDVIEEKNENNVDFVIDDVAKVTSSFCIYMYIYMYMHIYISEFFFLNVSEFV
jgi:hypothetical protein